MISIYRLTFGQIIFILFASDSDIVSIRIVFALTLFVKKSEEILLGIAGVMHHAIVLMIIHEHKHFQITQYRKLYAFLEETLLSLAKCDLSDSFIFDQLDFIDFLLSHFGIIYNFFNIIKYKYRMTYQWSLLNIANYYKRQILEE